MVTPYGDSRSKSEQVAEMFDNIAPAYDFMNRAMTLGIDRSWRRKAVDSLRGAPGTRILDIASGTGDLAILTARRIGGSAVTGVDLSEGMIEIGRRKVEREGLGDRVEMICGDCLALPFEEGSFDGVTCAFGVRNFQDIPAGLREMHRVLRPGGRLAVLELTVPTSAWVRPLYRLYTRGVIPLAGRIASGDSKAYTYLPESIAATVQRGQMTALMREAGFSSASFRALTFGVCCLYTAEK